MCPPARWMAGCPPRGRTCSTAADTRPLFQWLLGQPRVELMDVARALIFLKSRERYLHVTVRLPSLLVSMPINTQVELLSMVQRQGVHSGVTDPGLL